MREFRPLGKLVMTAQKGMSTVRGNVRYHNIFDAAKSIWRDEGLTGFFKGMKMRMVIQSASSGIGWGTYQLVKGLITKSTQH